MNEDFLWFVIIFGFGFVIMYRLNAWALDIVYKEKVENPCEGLHNWHYDEQGHLRCTVCKFKALDD